LESLNDSLQGVLLTVGSRPGKLYLSILSLLDSGLRYFDGALFGSLGVGFLLHLSL
jgi:hypothetical protein